MSFEGHSRSIKVILPSCFVVSSNGSRKEPSIANASNIDTLLGATEKSELAQPSESVQDKVHFIFNNISTNNLTQKVRVYLFMRRAKMGKGYAFRRRFCHIFFVGEMH